MSPIGASIARFAAIRQLDRVYGSDNAIDFAREGDVLCVTKLDRLARSVAHLCELVARLQAKSVALRILNLNIDTGTPTGKLMLHLLGSIAEFERQNYA
jgi:DNA invertase Pin-like site-specific DNA recombinase